MRVLAAVLLLSSVSGAAAAQSASDWSGPYVGVMSVAQAASDGEAKTLLERGRDSRLTYVAPLPGQSFENPSFDDTVSPVVFAGWRRSVGDLVLGLEAQLQYGGGTSNFSNNLSHGGFGLTQNCGVAAIGCLFAGYDEVVADIEIERIAALRVNVGVPLGDRVLVSAYAGPALAWGDLNLTQTSEFRTGRMPISFNPDGGPGECQTTCSIPRQLSQVTEVRSRRVEDTAWGMTLGLTVDLKLTDRLTARADVGYSRFEALRGSPGGIDGAESEVWAQPAGFTGGLGFSVRF